MSVSCQPCCNVIGGAGCSSNSKHNSHMYRNCGVASANAACLAPGKSGVIRCRRVFHEHRLTSGLYHELTFWSSSGRKNTPICARPSTIASPGGEGAGGGISLQQRPIEGDAAHFEQVGDVFATLALGDQRVAAAISSPLASRSHPRSMASTTTWPVRA
jgi:hypothetical protein